MALTITTGTVTSGPQITSLMNSEATITLDDHPLATVETKNVATRAVTIEDTSAMTAVSTPAPSPGFVWVFDSARLSGGVPAFRLTLTATVNDAVGVEAVTIVPSFIMADWAAATECFHCVSIEIDLPLIGLIADARILYPGIVHEMVKWDDATALPANTKLKIQHPGTLPTGGPSVASLGLQTGLIQADEPSGNMVGAATMLEQMVQFYDDASKDGLCIRTTDNAGRHKVFSYERANATQNIIVRVHMAPQDNSIGLGGNSDANPLAYGLELKPLVGDWNNAMRYYKQRKVAEGHPVYMRTPILEDDSRSPRVKNLVCWAPCLGNTTPFDFEDFYQQLVRIKEYFGGRRYSVAGIWYGTTRENLGSLEPSNPLANGNASEKMRDAFVAGVTVLGYCIQVNPIEHILKALTLRIRENLPICRPDYTSPAPGNVVASGQPFTGEHFVEPVTAIGAMHPNGYTFLSDENNKALAEYYAAQFDAGFVGGLYHDTDGLRAGTANEDPTLDPSQRGPGAAGNIQGMNQFRDYARRALEVPDGITAIEWPGEFHLAQTDITTWVSIGNDGVTPIVTESPQVWGPATLYSRYVRYSTFNDFSYGPNAELDAAFQFPGIIVTAEVFAAAYTYYCMGGMLMPARMQWVQAPVAEKFVPKASDGDGAFAGWFTAREEFYKYCKRLWWNQSDLTKRFHMGDRLFESADQSVVRVMVDNKLKGLQVQLQMYTQAWHDPMTGQVGIQAANWTMTAAQITPAGTGGATYVWAETFTRANFPELDMSCTVELVNCETGARVAQAAHPGGVDYVVPNISVGPTEVFWLVFTPA